LSEWATRAFFLYGGQRIAGICPPIDMHSGFPIISPGILLFSVKLKCLYNM